MKNFLISILFFFIMQSISAQTPQTLFSGTWHGTPSTPFSRMVQKVTFENNQLAFEIDEGASYPYKDTIQIVKIIPQTQKPYGVIFVKFKTGEYDQEGAFTCFLYRNKNENQMELTNLFPTLMHLPKKNTMAELENEIENPIDDRNLLEVIAEMGWQIFLSPSAYQKMLALPNFPLNNKNAYIKVQKEMMQEIKDLMVQFPKKEIDPDYANLIFQKLNFCKIMMAQSYNCSEQSMGQFNVTKSVLNDKNDVEFMKLQKEFKKLLGNE